MTETNQSKNRFFFFSGTLNEVKEMKGLDIVRRDWCDLAKDSGKYVFSFCANG